MSERGNGGTEANTREDTDGEDPRGDRPENSRRISDRRDEERELDEKKEESKVLVTLPAEPVDGRGEAEEETNEGEQDREE